MTRDQIAARLRFEARDHRPNNLDSFASVHTELLLQAAEALAQGMETRRAKTAKPVECEA